MTTCLLTYLSPYLLTRSLRDLLQLLLLSEVHLNLAEHWIAQLHQLHHLLDEANVVCKQEAGLASFSPTTPDTFLSKF